MIRKMVFVRLSLCACVILAASCGGGGGSSDSGGGGTPAISEVLSATLPGFSHQIDIYNTAGATKAVVFLHGGGGTNYQVAFDLGINSVDDTPSTATANWTWLEGQKLLAVFPQGQANSGAGYTWNNHVMVSGQDDVAFLQALASYIQSTYGISSIYLAGHSNGGMMVNRMWCESPTTYDAYVAIAGPASSYYLTTPCAPSVEQPYYGIVGELDNVLQVSGNWGAPTWTINPLLTATNFVNPTLIGEWNNYQSRSLDMCGEDPAVTGMTSDGSVETWSNCGGQLGLKHVLQGAHTISSLETGTGSDLIDLIAAYLGI